MADTWGGLSLNITAYKRPGAQTYLVEKELLAPYNSRQAGNPNTVLMGTGRKRKTREVEGWASRADYAVLLFDFLNATAKSVSFEDGFNFVARLWKLEGKEEPDNEKVWYSAVFIES
ncbi:MAG: hypothetical protein N2645_20035 [Clostridia bacterium]|nr:hypothetical protein [Clostridia bacterium]